MFMQKYYPYKLLISYNGTDYSGWQRQSVEYKTIQGEIESAIQKILKHNEFNFYGSSRTDTGVHASGQIALLKTCELIDETTFLKKLNHQLPSSIRVLSFTQVDMEFNPQINIVSKEYHYYFSEKPVSAHNTTYVLNLRQSLHIENMQEACKLLIGKHCFSNFTTDKLASNNTKREIFSCEIFEEHLSFQEEKVFVFKIEGSGFLKYMIRHIFAQLLEIGIGESSIKKFENLLLAPNDTRLKKAPAKGLHLVRINYSGK